MSQALLAVQNILQNSNTFNRTQLSGFLPTSVSYLKLLENSTAAVGGLWLVCTFSSSLAQLLSGCGRHHRQEDGACPGSIPRAMKLILQIA